MIILYLLSFVVVAYYWGFPFRFLFSLFFFAFHRTFVFGSVCFHCVFFIIADAKAFRRDAFAANGNAESNRKQANVENIQRAIKRGAHEATEKIEKNLKC